MNQLTSTTLAHGYCRRSSLVYTTIPRRRIILGDALTVLRTIALVECRCSPFFARLFPPP